MAVASKVQKQHEVNTLTNAMAEQRVKDEESKADAEFRSGKINVEANEIELHRGAEEAERRLNLGEAAQRFREVELLQQRDHNHKEYIGQTLRDETNALAMQQRLVELEHQCRTSAEDMVSLTELKQRELTLKEECGVKNSLESRFQEEQRRIRALAESQMIAKENKMQLDFEEKYQTKFRVVQAELDNQFVRIQAEGERMRSELDSRVSAKDREI